MTTSPLDLRGVFPPVTTPFTADGALHLGGLVTNIRKYNAIGLKGYVVLGSTGESVFLGEEEKLRVLEAVRASAGPGKLLIAGTGCEATAETIALTHRAAESGYQAALVRTPSYFKSQMTDAAWERHFHAVADASSIPILLYSVPQFTGLAVEAPLVARLAAHPNIIGIKESSGNLQRVGEVLRTAPSGFQVLVGSATTFYPSLCLGVHGTILAVACVLPELCLGLHESYQRGDHERARALQQQLQAPTVAVTSRFGIGGLKFAMELRGYCGGPPRPPLLPPDAAAQAELRRLFAGSGVSD